MAAIASEDYIGALTVTSFTNGCININTNAGGADSDGGQQRDRPGCWRPTPRPDRCAAQGHAISAPKWACNYRFGVKLVTPPGAVNAARHHDRVMTVPFANNPANTAGAGQGVEA